MAEELEEQKLRTAQLNFCAVGDDLQSDNVWRNCEIDTSTLEGLSANATHAGKCGRRVMTKSPRC